MRGASGPQSIPKTASAATFAAGFAAFAAFAALAFSACADRPPERRNESIFQSVCTVTLYSRGSGREDDATFDALWERLREIDSLMNMWNDRSALSALNAAAGSGPVPVPPEIAHALAPALRLADLSGGRYDPTVGALVKLWGVGTSRARVPAAADIAAASATLDRGGVRVDAEAGTVDIARALTILDFGSIAKGYGAMEAGRLLAARGVRSAIIDVGGCVLALGSRPDGTPWRIGVQDPSGARGAAVVGYFPARDAAVATSGIYERSFVEDGATYHHIMDTATGYPIANELVSVSVMASRHVNSDGPPLAMLALGSEEGIALADRLNLPAVFILRDRRVRLSAAAEGLFVPTAPDYEVLKP